MNYTKKDFAGFVVFVLDIFFDNFRQRFVSGFIALYKVANAFVDDDEVVVFVEDLEVGFCGDFFHMDTLRYRHGCAFGYASLWIRFTLDIAIPISLRIF